MIEGHWLVDADTRYAVETKGPYPLGAPEYIVMHFTQMGSVKSSVDLLNSRGFGYHVLIDRDGTVHQMAPFDQMTWHAGTSNWRGRVKMNDFCVGVSLANHGPLSKVDSHYEATFGARFERNEVTVASHYNGHPKALDIAWERFPDAQVAAALDVCRALAVAYPIRDVLRHDDIAVGRKLDTGPALDFAPFHALVDRSGERGELHRVMADGAEVRSTYSTRGRRLGRLAKGREVHVLSRAYTVRGTVSSFCNWCLVSEDGATRLGFMRVRDLESIEPMV